ncbi:MAG: hypothetical protein ABIQ30_01190 [Devosia sp.]
MALAKLHGELSGDTKPEGFAAILAKDIGDTGDADFVEAHVYGSLNRNAISSITGPLPRLKEDRILWKSLIERATALQIETATI